MYSMEWDAIKASLWALFGSRGAYTGPHHDAAGMCTYVICKTGTKLWGYVIPASTQVDDMKLYRAMVEGCGDYGTMTKLGVPTVVDILNTTLEIPMGSQKLVL